MSKFDVVGRTIYKRRNYEDHICSFLLENNFSANGTYIDVGANVGYYTVLFSKLAGENGTVYAFEPEQHNFSLLQKNIEKNKCGNTKVFPLALGNEESVMSLGLYKKSNRGRHSLLKDYGLGTVPVKVDRLDNYVGDGKIDVLKIDVEGFELYVLEGAETILPRVETLIMEFSPEDMREADLSVAKLVEILKANFTACYVFNDVKRLVGIDMDDLASMTGQRELVFRK